MNRLEKQKTSHEEITPRGEDFGALPNGFLSADETDIITATRQQGMFLSILLSKGFNIRNHPLFAARNIQLDEAAPTGGFVRTVQDKPYHFLPLAIVENEKRHLMIHIGQEEISLHAGLAMFREEKIHVIMMKSKPPELRKPKISHERTTKKIPQAIELLAKLPPPVVEAYLHSMRPKGRQAIEHTYGFEQGHVIQKKKNHLMVAQELGMKTKTLNMYLHSAYQRIIQTIKSEIKIHGGKKTIYTALLPPEIVQLVSLSKNNQQRIVRTLPLTWRSALVARFNLDYMLDDIPYTRAVLATADKINATPTHVHQWTSMARDALYLKFHNYNEYRGKLPDLPKDMKQLAQLPIEKQEAFFKAIPYLWRKDLITQYNWDLKFGNQPYERDKIAMKQKFKKTARFSLFSRRVTWARDALRAMLQNGAPLEIPHEKIKHKPHKLKDIPLRTPSGVEIAILPEPELNRRLSYLNPRQKDIVLAVLHNPDYRELAVNFRTSVSSFQWSLTRALLRMDGKKFNKV